MSIFQNSMTVSPAILNLMKNMKLIVLTILYMTVVNELSIIKSNEQTIANQKENIFKLLTI